MAYLTIERENYRVEFDTPEIFVDNQARKRSGHMTHAMAEYAPGCFINFNANCSATRATGHSVYGWVEYRFSEDAGKTYSEIQTLPYSWEAFLNGSYTISVEKAVACDDGSIVAICLRNSMISSVGCEPWYTPTWIRSSDCGKTWSEPQKLSEYAGRPYDALYHDGVIYVLHKCGAYFCKDNAEDVYRLYASFDNGLTFEEVSVLPITANFRGYGSMVFDNEGRLHAYAYNMSSETEMDHAVSTDNGRTWTLEKPCYLAKKIRNPQVALIDGVYIAHGRSGLHGFVFYTSENGCDWDEGVFLGYHEKSIGDYYSNNINLRDGQGNFLLVQYSENYDNDERVNVKHVRLRVKRK